MGETVYDVGPVSEGARVFAHSRKDGEEGVVYLVINNSLTETTIVELPALAPVVQPADKVELAPCTCTFFVP